MRTRRHPSDHDTPTSLEAPHHATNGSFDVTFPASPSAERLEAAGRSPARNGAPRSSDDARSPNLGVVSEFINYPTNDIFVIEEGAARVNGNILGLEGPEEGLLMVLAQVALARTSGQPVFCSTKALLAQLKTKRESDYIFKIVSAIRGKLREDKLNPNLLDSKPRAGYWLGTPPEQITLLVHENAWFRGIGGAG
jgi:hypothetical protein